MNQPSTFDPLQNGVVAPSSDVLGFLVVRKPEFHYDPDGKWMFPTICSPIMYYGMDRLEWVDFIIPYYSYPETIPDSLKNAWKEFKDIHSAMLAFSLCTDFEIARSILDFVNQPEERNELIVLQSTNIQQRIGDVSLHANIEWLGWDVLLASSSSLSWSMISLGVFHAPMNSRAL